MIRINIEKPVSSIIYSGDIFVNNDLHYFFIIETALKTEIHWLGLDPVNKVNVENKIIEQLNKINKYDRKNN